MRIARLVRRTSDGLARVERVLLMGLTGAVALLVLLNVATRAAGYTLAWADELAVYGMVMGGFVGASLMLRMRTAPAVTIVYELVPDWAVRGLRTVVSTIAFLFGLVLIWLCWRWFDLGALAGAGFDVAAFEGQTFNFLYTERSPVLGARMIWFYVVIPWFALTLSVHALTNLVEDLGLIAPPPPEEATP